MSFEHRKPGFILPTLIVLSLVLMSIGLVVLQYVSSSTNSLQAAFYGSVAKEAANAGASFAYGCLRNNNGTAQWAGAKKVLTPGTDCGGTAVASGNDCTAVDGLPQQSGEQNTSADASTLSRSGNGLWKSRFSVCEPSVSSGGVSVTSVGIVEFYYAGASTPSRTFINSTKVNVPYDLTSTTVLRASGKAITQIEGGGIFNCAVANAALYCWGQNGDGQLGLGDTSNRSVPTRVNTGDLANKRINSVTTGALNSCALADGRAFCWGRNPNGAIGNGSTGNSVVTPTKVQGDLATTNITKASASYVSINGEDSTHICALTNGKIYCWGDNRWGQLGQPLYVSSFSHLCDWGNYSVDIFTQICYHGSDNRTLARLTTPTPVFGFSNRNGESSYAYLSGKRVTDIDAGLFGSCVTANGRAFCWGDNLMNVDSYEKTFGGTTLASASNGAKDFTGSGNYITAIASGAQTACAVTNGTLYCWGRMRGDGSDNLYFYSPSRVPNQGSPPAAVALEGGDVVLQGVKSSIEMAGAICGYGSGNAYCWGIPQPNRLYTKKLGPIVDSTEAITDVGTGGGSNGTGGIFGTFSGDIGNVCYLANGTVYCLGGNKYGSVGSGSSDPADVSTFTRTATSNPAATIGLTSGRAATDITSGNRHNCAIIDGQPFCWGNNSNGQLGSGTLDSLHPTGVDGLPNTRSSTKVEAGYNHTCSITGGHAYCWGDNAFGQVGAGAANPQRTAYRVIGNGIENMAITDISAGRTHTCAVANSKAYCWGDGSSGQLGNGSNSNSSTPTAVRASIGDVLYGKQVTKITTGDKFTCAIADGLPYCWGDGSSGQLGNGSNSNSNLPVSVSTMSGTSTDIQAGSAHVCVIEMGMPKCWGLGTSGQLGNGGTTNQNTPQGVVGMNSAADPPNITSMSVGATHTCAIANTTGYCWGDQTNGRLGNGMTAGISSVPSAVTETNGTLAYGPQNIPYRISAGPSGSCAVANAKLYCWGDGSFGQTGDDTNTSTVATPTITNDYTRSTNVFAWNNTIFY